MAAQVGMGVTRKVSLMPAHVSLVVLTLTCGFGLLTSVRARRGIASVPVDGVRSEIARWSGAPLALLRDTMLLYSRLARFQYHSLAETPENDDSDA